MKYSYQVEFEDGGKRRVVSVKAKSADDAMAIVKSEYPAALIVRVT
jgi:hypothetical protein